MSNYRTELDLENFGQFNILGHGSLEPLPGDGGFRFHRGTAYEALKSAGWCSAYANDYRFTYGDIERSIKQGWKHSRFVIQHKGEVEYGFYTGDDLAGCLESYFKILSENGLTIQEEI